MQAAVCTQKGDSRAEAEGLVSRPSASLHHHDASACLGDIDLNDLEVCFRFIPSPTCFGFS